VRQPVRHLRRTLSSKPSPRPLAANFRQRSVCSRNFPRHRHGPLLPIDAHQRFTVIRHLPSACVALKDTQQDDDQWVVVFVRKTDFDLLHGSPDHPSARNRHGAAVQGASRGVPPPSHAGTASTSPEEPVDKAHPLSDGLRRQRHSRVLERISVPSRGAVLIGGRGNPRRRLWSAVRPPGPTVCSRARSDDEGNRGVNRFTARRPIRVQSADRH
jgi:hypothetical protein